MTITKNNPPVAGAAEPGYLPFRIAAGRPSMTRLLSREERLGFEEALIATLRGFTSAVASHCNNDDPFEYADVVADLTEVDPGDSPTVWSTRLASLLHMYADYMPAGDCTFVDMGPACNGWIDADGRVVVDVVTTVNMCDLGLGMDEAVMFEAALNGRHEFGPRFAGVRYIVLDSPFESTWNPVEGEPQPLLDSDLNPVLCDLESEGGEWA